MTLAAPGQHGPTRTARGVALAAMVDVDTGGWANLVVPSLLDDSALDRRDRAFVTELVYGTVRARRACDWLVDRHARGQLDLQVRNALRLGVYQLAFLHTPAHAALAATVAEVRGPGRRLVNAVLRRVAGELSSGPPRWPSLAVELSYPDWIVQQLGADLGQPRALDAMRTMNEPARATPRADGYIQDLASQLVADAVGARAGERILDVCAAPGGKATAMAYGQAMPPEGWAGASAHEAGSDRRPALVVAADLQGRRVAQLAANLRRLALGNVVAVVADATRPPWPPGAWDRVLVDAPCSGLGVLRRRPDARWRVQPADVERLARLQRRLLDQSLPLVRPGGILVYSVCTLTRAETAAIDRYLARHYPDWQPVAPPGSPWEPAGRGALLLPQVAGTDGMFLLRLRRPARPAIFLSRRRAGPVDS